jgi:hypothetical protein
MPNGFITIGIGSGMPKRGYRSSGWQRISETERSKTFMIQRSILHSVSYSGSWGQQLLSLQDFVDKAADLGFDGVS